MCIWCSVDAGVPDTDQPRTGIPESWRATVRRLVCRGRFCPQHHWYAVFAWPACCLARHLPVLQQHLLLSYISLGLVTMMLHQVIVMMLHY